MSSNASGSSKLPLARLDRPCPRPCAYAWRFFQLALKHTPRLNGEPLKGHRQSARPAAARITRAICRNGTICESQSFALREVEVSKSVAFMPSIATLNARADPSPTSSVIWVMLPRPVVACSAMSAAGAAPTVRSLRRFPTPARRPRRPLYIRAPRAQHSPEDVLPLSCPPEDAATPRDFPPVAHQFSR